MADYNYPIRVLKRKMGSKNYKPFAIDCESGEKVKVKYSKTHDILYYSFQAVLVIISLIAIYYLVVQPTTQTTLSRLEANEIVSSLGGNDKATVKKIENLSEVLSKNASNGTLQLLVKVDKDSYETVLGFVFSLSGIKEVHTDGDVISFTVISSEQ